MIKKLNPKHLERLLNNKCDVKLYQEGLSEEGEPLTSLNIENQKVIDDFLKKHPEFVQEKTYTKNKLKDERDTLSLTIYPDDYMSDGFFIATLRKK